MKRWGFMLLGSLFLFTACTSGHDTASAQQAVTPVTATSDSRQVNGATVNEAPQQAVADNETGAAPQAALANDDEDQPEAAPSADDVWVDPVTINDDVVVPGFWRPQAKAGFVWHNGSWDEDNDWLPGYWTPSR